MHTHVHDKGKMKNTAITAGLAALCIIISGCTKQSLETTYSNQEERIETYVQTLLAETDDNGDPIHSAVRNGGATRVILTPGTGPALSKGGTVSFYYAGYIFNGSLSANNLFATNNETFAAENGWELTDADYSIKKVRLTKDSLLEGLYLGLHGVRAGEVCMILFSGEYGYGEKHVGTIPANSALAYQIWVTEVSN